MDFPDCNSRAQDVALRHTERQVFICTVQGQQSQRLEYTQGAFLTFYIMFGTKRAGDSPQATQETVTCMRHPIC